MTATGAEPNTAPATHDFGLVLELKDGLSPNDIDAAVKSREADERISHVRTIVDAWKTQQDQERSMRKVYATVLVVTLIIELLVIFIAFFVVFFTSPAVSPWMIQSFLVTALVQSSAMILVVIKYLFPDRSSDISRLLESSVGRENVKGAK